MASSVCFRVGEARRSRSSDHRRYLHPSRAGGSGRHSLALPSDILSDALDHPDDHPDDRSGSFRAVWTESASNLSSLDPSGADQTDAEHQATDLAVGGSSPSRRAASLQGCSSTSNGRSARARSGRQPRPRGQRRQPRAGNVGLDDSRRSKTGTGAAGSEQPGDRVTASRRAWAHSTAAAKPASRLLWQV